MNHGSSAKSELEKAFSATTAMLLGTPLTGLDRYEQWISKHVPQPKKVRSVLSGKDVWIPPSMIYLRKSFEHARVISLDETENLPQTPHKAEELTANTKDISVQLLVTEFVEPIRYYCGNYRYLTYANIEECSGAGDGQNIYRCDDVYLKVKNIAFSNYTILQSQNAFGCHGVTSSDFIIHAYNSTKITRCLEVDSCSNSSDLLFCHNCENVHDSMFCFNAKNLRNAIGNVPVQPQEYKRIKALVQKEMVTALQRDYDFPLDIFNIGCRTKRR